MTPQHAYHVSALPLHLLQDGKPDPSGIALLHPKSPTCGEERLAHIPRICVAPSPAQCLAALGMHLWITPHFWVYQTRYEVTPAPAVDVIDQPVTGEGWLLTPTTFFLVGQIPRASFDEQAILAHEDEEQLDNDILLLNLTCRGRHDTLGHQRSELYRIRHFLNTHWAHYQQCALETLGHSTARGIAS